MDYLGLFALGTFLGSIAAIGVRYIDSVESWQKVLLAILPAVLSGVAIAFVDRFKYSPAIGAYPLGLIVAFLWTYSDVAAKNFARKPIKQDDQSSGGYDGQRTLGVLHFLASGVVTVAAIVLLLPPALSQVEAERAIKLEVNVAYLLKQRDLAIKPSDTASVPK